MRWFLLHTTIIILILVLGASPFISAMIAGTIADSNGCVLHEGFVNPCVINGEDWGETLYTMGVIAWLGLGTLPIAIMAAFVYLVVVIIVSLILRSRRKRAAQASSAPTN